MAKTLLSLSDVNLLTSAPRSGWAKRYTRLIVVVDGKIPYEPQQTVESAKYCAADAMKRDITCEPAVYQISWPSP